MNSVNQNTENDTFSKYAFNDSQKELYNCLNSLGLQKYYETLIDNEIFTKEVLFSLTMDELKELGFSLGARRTILIQSRKHPPEDEDNNNDDNKEKKALDYAFEQELSTIFNYQDNVAEETMRPMGYVIMSFMLSIVIPPLGCLLCMAGHKVSYKFDNEQQTFDYEEHRGAFCRCLGLREYHLNYSDVSHVKVQMVPTIHMDRLPIGYVHIITNDGDTLTVSNKNPPFLTARRAKIFGEKLAHFAGFELEDNVTEKEILLNSL